MPPGAKKRKALKKKQQQQEAIGTSRNNNNGDNLHGGGNEEHGGSQDDRESDSNLSSPGSPGNGQFGGIQDPSVAIACERGMDDKEIIVEKSGNVIAGERGTNEKKFIVEKSPVSSYESMSQTDKNEASQDHCVKEIAAPVVDFDVSKVVIHEKSEHAETSTHSELAIDKSGEDKECPTTGLGEKENGKVATLMESAAGTSRKVESARESEVSPPSEEKSLLLPGPPAVRTSWLSCCGLFDAITGSDR